MTILFDFAIFAFVLISNYLDQSFLASTSGANGSEGLGHGEAGALTETWSNVQQKQNVQVNVWSLDPFFHWFANQSLASTIPLPPDPNCTCNARWCHAAMKIWQRQLPDFMCVRTPRVVNFGWCFFWLRRTSLSLGGTPFDSSWVHVREVLRVLEARLFHGSGLKWQEVVVAQSDKNFTAHDRVFRYSECRM